MLSIDKLVNGAIEVKFLSFIDAYFGYNQIRIHPLDEEKTTFIIENANYCYKIILFGLSIGATYQRLMNKVFAKHIRRIMEVYIDDMVAKTMGEGDHCEDLWDLEKCALGVSGGKFLGFLLTSRGIEVNSEKC